jgi:transposase
VFIRRVTVLRRGKRYSYYRIVESVRTPKGPRQRLVMSLGKLQIPQGQWKLLAERIEDFLYGQGQLPYGSQEVDPLAREIAERVAYKRQRQARGAEYRRERAEIYPQMTVLSQARQLGPEYVGLQYAKKLHVDRILQEQGLEGRQLELALIEIVGRLVEPHSELSTVAWYRRSALGEMLHSRGIDRITEDDLYRVTDRLHAKRLQIEGALRERERSLFGLKETIILYDLTSTYFEGLPAMHKARRGYSRDHRGDCLQVVVGLVLDGQGYAKGHEIFEGNRRDSTTLEHMLLRLEQLSPAPGATVVMDRGIATEANLEYVRQHGYRYIVAASARDRQKLLGPKEPGRWIPFRQSEQGEVRIEGQLRREGEELYVLCHSVERENKDRGIRERFRLRLEEEVHKLRGRIEAGTLKDPAKVQQAIGRLRQRFSRAARFYRLEFTPERTLRFEPLSEALSLAGQTDGRYLLRTNRTDLAQKEIWELYIMLNRVERSFRSLKGSVGIRPIYHFKAERIEAHIFISVLAYHLLHSIEEQLRSQGDTRCWATVRDLLSTHMLLTITHQAVDGRLYELRRPTRPEAHHETLYRALRLPSTPQLRDVERSDNQKGSNPYAESITPRLLWKSG